MSKEIWNERYATQEYIYGKEPNRYFSEQLSLLRPGKLLLPAEGEGRNAVYAAKHGWEIKAFDQSPVARSKAMALSLENDVSFTYDLADIGDVAYPVNHFDAVALIFVHLPEDLRIRFHRQVITWLKPGGNLIIEAYSLEQLRYLSGGPKNEELLYTTDGLTSDFSSLTIFTCEQVVVHHDEGLYHRGEGSVIRMLAMKT